MTEPAHDLQEALRRVGARWDAARTERTLGGLPARRRRRQLGRVLASAGVVGAVVVLGLLATPVVERADERAAPVAASTVASPAVSERADALTLRLPDGSQVEPADASARVVTERATPQLVALRLDAGRARFDVARDPARLFRVRSGQVTVEVLGTAFTLTRRAEQTRVEVEHGAVAVRWGEQRRELRAGESGWFPPALEADDQASVPAELDGHATEQKPADAEGEAATVARRGAVRGWREHAEQGEFKRAYQLLQRPEAAVAPDVSELMLAADAARLSGHPAAAVPYLRQVMDRHPADARAPLAAFTLGGVLMNQLGLPREAEAAYASARQGTRSAALAQDALARQVEAASRAGDEALARRLAQRYVREYPEGRRVRAVRRFGGL